MNSFGVPVVIILVFLRFSDSPAFSLFLALSRVRWWKKKLGIENVQM
jgi:hypothetical protein